MDRKNHNLWIRWLIFAVLGLICAGAGLSIAIEAGIQKMNGQSWFWMGTGGLIAFNSGISMVGQSVIYKCRLERLKTTED